GDRGGGRRGLGCGGCGRSSGGTCSAGGGRRRHRD
ncbi:unnamed protein product, partial [Rotaria sp. Silwood2]